MQDKKLRVIAVIVTFNRKFLLEECINSLLKQTYKLYKIVILDNASTDGTKEYLEEKKLLNKVEYFRLKKNTGASGGFYYGMMKAMKYKSDWIWLMDDDAEAEKNSLKYLIDNISQDSIALFPKVIHLPSKKIEFWHRGYFEIEKTKNLHKDLEINHYNENKVKITKASFIGLFVRSSKIEDIGYPIKDFFIWVDDIEYTYRISTHGNMYLINKSIMFHKDTYGENINNFIPLNQLWKKIHEIRNYILLSRKYRKNHIYRYISYARIFYGINYEFITNINNPHYDRRFYRIYSQYKGFLYGILGRKGKINI